MVTASSWNVSSEAQKGEYVCHAVFVWIAPPPIGMGLRDRDRRMFCLQTELCFDG